MVRFEGVDTNTCCGTHVQTLAHLMAVKLVRLDRTKGCNSKVHFLAGERVLRALGSAAERERALGQLLSVGPELLVESVSRVLEKRDELTRSYSVRTTSQVCTIVSSTFGGVRVAA